MAEESDVSAWLERLQPIVDAVDLRLRGELRAELETLLRARRSSVARRGRWVLVGHRAAGKSRLLPHFARLAGLPAIDLDQLLEQRAGRTIRAWFEEDAASFRAAERALFQTLPEDTVVAAGGGFLALHSDLLVDQTAVLVPVTLETYVERLSADTTRPRLRPELSLRDELETVFREREALHARVSTVRLVDALVALTARPRRV